MATNGASPTWPQFAHHREHLALLRAAALHAVNPAEAVRRHLTPADWDEAERVWLVGAGKAGVAMAQAAAELLGPRLSGGVVSVPQVPAVSIAGLHFIAGGHPLPSEGSLEAGRAIAELLAQTGPNDLVIALISGGGSALLELPRAGLTLHDLQVTNNHLLRCGATIHEVNIIRGALSQIKRGGLARLAQPAQVLSLILSDVVGNPLDIIASGPTVVSTILGKEKNKAWPIVEKYQLQTILPQVVLQILQTSSTPAATSAALPVAHRLIASNRLAGEAAVDAAQALGFNARFIADDWQGEAREVGQRWAASLAREQGYKGDAPLCLIAGGETTVTVRGPGHGGRNQELALAAALAIDGQPNTVISTLATDGVDGPTDAAGAIVTGETIARARALGLDPHHSLENNDAYTFFAALNDLILTGPTGTNVNDLLFGLLY